MPYLMTINLALVDNQTRKDIRQWLAAPDPSTNHNKACDKHWSGTGGWLFRLPQYIEWKTKANSFLWIKGKRMLCSIATINIHTNFPVQLGVARLYSRINIFLVY
jgi:hypothetical protein